MYRLVLVFMLLAAFVALGTKGCEVEIPEIPPGGEDLDSDGIPDGWDEDCKDKYDCDWDEDDWDDECKWEGKCKPNEMFCEDVGWEYFGPCDRLLGWAVAFGECQPISGCDPGEFEFEFFDNKEACVKACLRVHGFCDELVKKYDWLVKISMSCQGTSDCRLVEDFGGCFDAVNQSFSDDAAAELREIYQDKGCLEWVCDYENMEFEAICMHGTCQVVKDPGPPVPTCKDLLGRDFGACAMVLGYGVVGGECRAISGCDSMGVELFENIDRCIEACDEPADEVLCEETGGVWDLGSCGHYHCGEFPPCDAILPGCNCGERNNFAPGRGCVADPDCMQAPSCDDLANVDFGDCEMAMGYGVVGGECQMISGCGSMGYSFFPNKAECMAVCGGCHHNEDCAEGQYCMHTDCAENSKGTCVVKPEGCFALYDPVCGCDGNTYGNACDAAALGMSVKHEGECAPEPQCTSNDDCYLWSNYCGTCQCMAMAHGDPIPMCPQHEMYYCFVDPCMYKIAVCDNGSCMMTAQ